MTNDEYYHIYKFQQSLVFTDAFLNEFFAFVLYLTKIISYFQGVGSSKIVFLNES